MKKKLMIDLSRLTSPSSQYRRIYLGNILFTGKLIKASATFGCFVTMNSDNPFRTQIPENVKVNVIT